MKLTSEIKTKITAALTAYLGAHPEAVRSEILEGVLPQLGLSERAMRNVSPGGKANTYRSYIGSVLTDMTAAGTVKQVGKGYFLAEDAPILVRTAQCHAPILALLAKGPMRKSEIFIALEAHFGTDKTATATDDGILRSSAGSALSELVRGGSVSVNEGIYRLRVRPLARRDTLPMPEAEFKKAFLSRIHERGGTFFEDFLAGALEKYFLVSGREVLSCEVKGGSTDGGVDIVLETKDALGFFDKVMVQAKCRESAQVTEKEVREFFGAMTAQGGTRGIYATTSTFHPGAKRFLDSIAHCVGIDGDMVFEIAKKTAYGMRCTKQGYSLDPNIFSP